MTAPDPPTPEKGCPAEDNPKGVSLTINELLDVYCTEGKDHYDAYALPSGREGQSLADYSATLQQTRRIDDPAFQYLATVFEEPRADWSTYIGELTHTIRVLRGVRRLLKQKRREARQLCKFCGKNNCRRHCQQSKTGHHAPDTFEVHLVEDELDDDLFWWTGTCRRCGQTIILRSRGKNFVAAEEGELG